MVDTPPRRASVDDREALGALLAIGRAGMEFYSRASRVAASPQTRLVFQRLAVDKEAQVEFLRNHGRALGRLSAGIKARKRDSFPPSIYPMSAIDPLVCFVCGEEVRDGQIPPECPTCGASGYSFEVDIDVPHAVRMARESERKSLEYVAQVSTGTTSAPMIQLLRRLAEMQEGFLSKLEEGTQRPASRHA